jgi:hypothetical protein
MRTFLWFVGNAMCLALSCGQLFASEAKTAWVFKMRESFGLFPPFSLACAQHKKKAFSLLFETIRTPCAISKNITANSNVV